MPWMSRPVAPVPVATPEKVRFDDVTSTRVLVPRVTLPAPARSLICEPVALAPSTVTVVVAAEMSRVAPLAMVTDTESLIEPEPDSASVPASMSVWSV